MIVTEDGMDQFAEVSLTVPDLGSSQRIGCGNILPSEGSVGVGGAGVIEVGEGAFLEGLGCSSRGTALARDRLVQHSGWSQRVSSSRRAAPAMAMVPGSPAIQ